MAAKVNKTVVFALIAGVICVLGGLMFMMKFVLRSGADLAAAGDALMAEGKFEEAAAKYSKAVNKDQNNIDFINKWAGSLAAQNPASLQAYSDRYRQWIATQRLIANVKRTDPAAYRTVLDLVTRDARIGGSGPAWQALESDASDIIARLTAQDGIDQIRRYRGIATVGKLGQALEVSVEDRKRAKEDLLAALKQNPTDALAAVYYADLMRLHSDKLRQAAAEEDADLAIAEGLAFMQEFCAKNPSSTVGRLGLYQLEASDLMNKARKDPSLYEGIAAQLKPKLETLVATLEAEDPKVVDEFVATQVLEFAAREKADNAVARGSQVFKRIIAARPNEPFAKLMMARFYVSSDAHREAADAFKAITELPNLPVSPEGIALFNVRDSAALQRVDALITLTSKCKYPSPERDAALAETKKARDELRARATISEPPKLLADAKIARLSGDNAEARKMLGQYHQATGYGDPQALFLSAQVLYDQGLKGEAKAMLQRLVDKRMANAAVYTMLARLDLELGNFPSSLTWIESALQLTPNDKQLRELGEMVRNAIRGDADDPFARAIVQANNAFLQTPPDLDLARAKLNSAVGLCKSVEQYVQVVRLLVRCSREDALAAANRGLEKFPAEPALTSLRDRLSIADPLKETASSIEKDTSLTPLDKQLRYYMLYSQAGDAAKAKAAIDEAEKLDPDHPLVIAGRFEEALATRDAEKAAVLAQKAKEKNLDKVDGRIYLARLAQIQGKNGEAIPLLERATELDAYNPLTWRYLGVAHFANGDPSKALRSYERSLQIKPDDVVTINARIQCLMAMDRNTDALAAAREAARLGISNPAFVQLWLVLEFRGGDKELALERRRFINGKSPENFENAVELAKNLLEVRQLEEAQRVMDEVQKLADKPETSADVRNALKQPMAMLRAALRGARGDTDGAMADLDALVAALPDERKETAYIEFSNIVSGFSGTANDSLVVRVLETGRKYQDARPKDAKGDAQPLARIDRMLGDLYFNSGQWEKARVAYGRARDALPTDADKLLLKRIIECHMKERQFDLARKLIDAQGGDKSEDLQILLLASQLESARGDRAKAIELLDRAASVAPKNYLPYRQRGLLKMEDPKQIDDAIVDFDLAIGIEPRNADLVVLLSRACVRKGDIDRALASLDKGLTIQPDNLALRNEKIQLLMNQNRTADALKECDAATKAEPSNPRWVLLKGILLQRGNDQRQAADVYEAAWNMRKGPDTGKAMADALIGAYDLTSPKEQALLARAQAVIDDPAMAAETEPMCRLSRMALRLRQNRAADAVADLKAVVSNPAIRLNDPQTGSFIVDELRRAYRGNMADVLAMLDQVRPAAGWPEAFQVVVARAEVNDRGGPDSKIHDAGIAHLQALSTSADKAVALAACGSLGGNLHIDAQIAAKTPGNEAKVRALNEQAVEVFQRGLLLDPESTELNNNLAYILARGLDRPADALPFAIKAAAKDPGNANVLDTLGAIQSMVNKVNEADDTLKRALGAANDGPTRTMPLIHLIEVKLKKGDRTAAEDMYRELLNIQATDPRVKANYSRDIEEVGKRMQGTP